VIFVVPCFVRHPVEKGTSLLLVVFTISFNFGLKNKTKTTCHDKKQTTNMVGAVSLLAVASLAVAPLPAPPRGYSTWQWFPGTHWGTKQGQYNAVDEVTCRTQADAMVAKGALVFRSRPCSTGARQQSQCRSCSEGRTHTHSMHPVQSNPLRTQSAVMPPQAPL
jgi:hypothetical protein